MVHRAFPTDPFEQAVCACATGHRRFPASQQRDSDNLKVEAELFVLAPLAFDTQQLNRGFQLRRSTAMIFSIDRFAQPL
jgi:hypothetical protein